MSCQSWPFWRKLERPWSILQHFPLTYRLIYFEGICVWDGMASIIWQYIWKVHTPTAGRTWICSPSQDPRFIYDHTSAIQVCWDYVQLFVISFQQFLFVIFCSSSFTKTVVTSSLMSICWISVASVQINASKRPNAPKVYPAQTPASDAWSSLGCHILRS